MDKTATCMLLCATWLCRTTYLCSFIIFPFAQFRNDPKTVAVGTDSRSKALGPIKCFQYLRQGHSGVLHLYRTVFRNIWSTLGRLWLYMPLIWQNTKQGIQKFMKCWKRPVTFKQTECFVFFTGVFAVMLSATPNPLAPVVHFGSLTM